MVKISIGDYFRENVFIVPISTVSLFGQQETDEFKRTFHTPKPRWPIQTPPTLGRVKLLQAGRPDCRLIGRYGVDFWFGLLDQAGQAAGGLP